jgi:hypothetical protein
MRYCYNDNHITTGKPLFCEQCGRSYDVKLCSRMHVNPRRAEFCSQCGSRDMSTPQPRVPFWMRIFVFLLSFLPGVILAMLSILTVVLLLKALLASPRMICVLVFLAIAAGTLTWVWTELPMWFRKAVYRLLTRSREREVKSGGR